MRGATPHRQEHLRALMISNAVSSYIPHRTRTNSPLPSAPVIDAEALAAVTFSMRPYVVQLVSAEAGPLPCRRFATTHYERRPSAGYTAGSVFLVRGQQESMEIAIEKSISRDLATVVDAISNRELPGWVGDAGVEINWSLVLPKASRLSRVVT